MFEEEKIDHIINGQILLNHLEEKKEQENIPVRNEKIVFRTFKI